MRWTHLINLFQPSSKSNDYVRRAATTCYLPIVEIIAAHPRAHLTVNLDGALAERLADLGHQDVLDGLRALAERGQVELTGSAYGGAILGPMAPAEMREAIERNSAACARLLGEVYRPTGLFPPEMAYDPPMAPVIRDCRFRWVVLDEMSHSGKPGTFLPDRLYRMEDAPEVTVVFRDRSLSTGILYGQLARAEQFLEACGERKAAPDAFVCTATEGDLYGMRRTGPRDFLVDMMECDEVEMLTVSEVLERIDKTEAVRPVSASWSTWDTLAF